ncbi:MAG TPA: type IV pilus assembly protein PilM [Candidatus Binatia bacterium]|nr:type IV pilus assembly protein PilM [Candidatus Binatia bacterium]
MALTEGLSGRSLLRRLSTTKIRNPFRRRDGFIVLDVGSSSLKLAEVQHGTSGPRVLNLAMAPLPPGAVQSNVVQDSGPVVEAIRAIVKERGIQTDQVITAVPGPAVIVKKIILPAESADKIEMAVLAEASNVIPDSLDRVNLDYQVTDWIEAGNKMEVLLVAVKREIINTYTDAIRAAELEPVLVDVDYFALENMFELNYDPPASHPVALVNIGARYSSINILKEGRSTFTGDVAVGGAEYSDALVRQLGVTAEQAESLKMGHEVKNVDVATVEPVLGSVTEFIVEEIQRSLSFFWTAATDEPLGGIVLSGGTARTGGLAAQLKQRLGCDVDVADPFRRVPVVRPADQELVQACGPALAVAVGLATRRPGDK